MSWSWDSGDSSKLLPLRARSVCVANRHTASAASTGSVFESAYANVEQAFTQADKLPITLPEGVNGRYLINPPPGSPEANNKDIVYEVLRPLYGNPSSPRALHKIMDAFFICWRHVSAHVDDSLLPANQTTLWPLSRRTYSCFLRDLVRDGHVKVVKCAGTQNVNERVGRFV